VTADRALITRALANLMGNAVKYSAEGTAIVARVFASGRFAAAEIVDEGRGIAEADLASLFEPFGRLAAPEGAAPSADAPGAGLGLAFVKTVVDRHQGRVEAHSELGRGSTFTIRLPRAA
jgi:signal transduction histidine kinase